MEQPVYFLWYPRKRKVVIFVAHYPQFTDSVEAIHTLRRMYRTERVQVMAFAPESAKLTRLAG